MKKSSSKISINSHGLHPWHGASPIDPEPGVFSCYIEIVPSDTVKFELDKPTGILKIDRPQRFSNQAPALYGFIPQSYCGNAIGDFCSNKVGRKGIKGDGDPLDIFVLTEKVIPHGDILVRAKPIGGLRMIDRGQADDKIIAVLFEDSVYGDWNSLSDCPAKVLERLRHYLLTYKQPPGQTKPVVEIAAIYDRAESLEVIELSFKDYRSSFLD